MGGYLTKKYAKNLRIDKNPLNLQSFNNRCRL